MKKIMRIYYLNSSGTETGSFYEFQHLPDHNLPAFDAGNDMVYQKEYKKVGRADGGLVIKKSRGFLGFSLWIVLTVENEVDLYTAQKNLFNGLRNNGGGNGEAFHLHEMVYDDSDVLVSNVYYKAELDNEGLGIDRTDRSDTREFYVEIEARLVSGDPKRYVVI